MAPPVGTLRVGPYFLALLGILALLYSIVFFGPRTTPKLGLDLVGGQQVIFTARGNTPSGDSMQQAKQIISDRVNGTGVTEAQVVIQGDNQIVVSIPGGSDADVQQLGAAAVLNFRGVVAPAVAVTCTPSGGASGKSSTAPSPSPSPSTKPKPKPSDSAAAANVRPLGKATPSGKSSGRTTAKSSPTASAATSAAKPSTSASPSTASSAVPSTPAAARCASTTVAQAAQLGKFTVPLDDTAYDALSAPNKQLLSAALANYDCPAAQRERDDSKSYFVACGNGPEAGVNAAKAAYLLGPVIVRGKDIDTAAAAAPNSQQGEVAWSVRLELKDAGQTKWGDYTTKHNVSKAKSTGRVSSCGSSGTPCADYVAFTLDGGVISSPVNESAIIGGATQVTGNFTPAAAKDLANKLKYGALPVSFRADAAQTVSATLGTAQLKAGLLAGGIGLVLVVVYSLIYYRALGLVTIASLLVSGGTTYACLVMLATQIGFTLSLAGIAGFIVAVGITADSFVVFFERLKDEVHEGRSVRVAVPRAWVRARRTILSADTVSFLAAAILYYFAAGDVKGFAFTLGLSTILDLVVVFLFTHPLVSLLSRSSSFGSARFTGLDALRSGPASSDGPDPRGRPGGSGRSARAATATAERAAPVVLEKLTDEPVEPAADEPVARVADEPVARVADEEPEEPAAGAVDPDESRRRTAPEPGSAAERAAARRARMREQRDQKGQG